MLDTAINSADRGAKIISITALAGTAVSLYNYFTPLSGIDGTPGAQLAIIATLILFALGIVLGTDRTGGAWRAITLVTCLVGILGTAFAAYLLESHALLILMFACLVGLYLHYAERNRSQAEIDRVTSERKIKS